jgi:hypothetical protein
MSLKRIDVPEAWRKQPSENDINGMKDLYKEWITQYTPYNPEKFFNKSKPGLLDRSTLGRLGDYPSGEILAELRKDADLEKWIQGSRRTGERAFRNKPYDPKKVYMPHLVSQAISRGNIDGDPRTDLLRQSLELVSSDGSDDPASLLFKSIHNNRKWFDKLDGRMAVEVAADRINHDFK